MRPSPILIVLLLCATPVFAQSVVAVSPWDGPATPNIRPGSCRIRETLVETYGRSATFRELVARVEASSTVVFVRSGRCAGGVLACLHLLAARGRGPTLRITVDNFSTGGAALAGLVAHELQHAAEIAADDSVRDVASLAAFYASHGRQSRAGFETEEARSVARRVEGEFGGKRASQSRTSRPPQ